MPPVPHPLRTTAAARRVALRLRPDLVLEAQPHGDQRYWVVKDPVALTYFHLEDEEHAILTLLDGRRSLAEIKRRFEETFAPLQVTLEQLQSFFARLYQSGLLLADAPGQGERLQQRGVQRRRRGILELFGNLLAIRFGGVDPDLFLRWLHARLRWLFSPWFLVACVAMVAGAGVLATVEFETLRKRLPDFHTFFSAGNMIWFAVALAVSKVLHELGHALACKHYGGECHEIGVLLLVFTPCLYCNVTDAWMFPRKWRRIAVSAAGMIVEIVLAAAATFLWWFSQPGLVHTLLLSIVVICSVNTLLLNGNPLLRYDGYYILSDLVEVPNLAQRSQAFWSRWLWYWTTGLRLPEERPLSGRRRLLVAFYGLASAAYRWLVVVAILWFVYRVLKPYGLEAAALLLSVLVFAGMLLVPLRNLLAVAANPAHRRQIRPGRVLLSVLLASAALAAILLWPVPWRIRAPAVVQAIDAHYVYVVVPGRVIRAVEPGRFAAKGETLVQLEDHDVRQEIVELAGQRNQQRMQLQNLRLRLADDPGVAPEIPAAEEALVAIETRLAQREEDQRRLTLRAPADGTVIAPPAQEPSPYLPGALRSWSGSPLEPRNRGSYLETGTLACLVGDPQRLEVVLVIDQADMKSIRRGQPVRLDMEQWPGQVVEGTIIELARTDLKVAPRELAHEGMPVQVDRQGVARPAETSYQARVALDGAPGTLRVGGRGQARVVVDPQPLGVRWYRALGRVFHFTQL